MKKQFFLTPLLVGLFATNIISPKAEAQEEKDNLFSYRIALQNESHYNLRKDNLLDSNGKPMRFMSNNYLDLWLQSKYLDAGTRVEYMPHPLPGLEMTKGYGVANIFIRGRYEWVQLTLGDSYDQFGTGLLFRAYEDRILGIDNSLRGAHLLLTPFEGLQIKALTGVQRNHFDRPLLGFNNKEHARGILSGVDLNAQFSQWIKPLKENDYFASLGFSFINKSERDNKDLKNIYLKNEAGQTLRLIGPLQVQGYSGRFLFQKGDFELSGEGAIKTSDPNRNNRYTYKNGTVAMLMASYATKGMSFLLGARRAENFDFRSDRGATLNDVRINHLLPFTPQESYSLVALRPYATQAQGEWAFQSEGRWSSPKKSSFWGKYGTQFRLFASYITGLKPLETNTSTTEEEGTLGRENAFWGLGTKYFHDYGVEVTRKFTPNYSAVLSYYNQAYNESVIAQHGTDIVQSHIWVYEGKHKVSSNFSLRTELQYLHDTKTGEALSDEQKEEERGDWAFGLIEIGIMSDWIISLSDQYNLGGGKRHYPLLSLAKTFGANRVQLSAGKTRAGINCSGGVCRYVPETSGINLSVSLNF